MQNALYHSFDYEMKKRYGCKVYRISLDAGMTCPNRDGSLGNRGCIFCSEGGSGDFAQSRNFSIAKQLVMGKERMRKKAPDCHAFVAYFQAYTNTYKPVRELEAIYREAMQDTEVVALSIATRPDCLSDEILSLLEELNREKPVWVELGLQTIHPQTAEFIRRGFSTERYDQAVEALQARGIEVITHVILGLPGESREQMKETVRHVADICCKDGMPPAGIKLQLLHVLKNTDLAELYEKTYDSYRVCRQEESGESGQRTRGQQLLEEGRREQQLSEQGLVEQQLSGQELAKYEQWDASWLWKDSFLGENQLVDYVNFTVECMKLLPEEMVIHRITGDGPKSLLVAPLWSGDKKRVLNTFTTTLKKENIWKV